MKEKEVQNKKHVVLCRLMKFYIRAEFLYTKLPVLRLSKASRVNHECTWRPYLSMVSILITSKIHNGSSNLSSVATMQEKQQRIVIYGFLFYETTTIQLNFLIHI